MLLLSCQSQQVNNGALLYAIKESNVVLVLNLVVGGLLVVGTQPLPSHNSRGRL